MYPAAPLIFALAGSYLGHTPVETAGPEAAAASGRDERSTRAYAAFEAQRHLEAALEFEGLWREFREPRFLFNAAVTRFALHHHAHAIAYLEEYMTLPGLSPEERGAAGVQLGVARKEAPQVAVTLRVVPAADGDYSIELERMPDTPSDLRPALSRVMHAKGGEATAALNLDGGLWTVRGRCSDGTAQSVQLDVDRVNGGRGTLELVCRSGTGKAADGARERRIASVALGVGGGTAAIVGGIVGGVFLNKRNGRLSESVAECGGSDECFAGLVGLQRSATAGTALVAFGGGLVLAGLAPLVRDARLRRGLQWGGVGAGGALLIGGFVGSGFALGTSNGIKHGVDDVWDDYHEDAAYRRSLRGWMAMESLLGLGSGFIVASAVGLIVDRRLRKSKRRQVAVSISPNPRGATMTLRF